MGGDFGTWIPPLHDWRPPDPHSMGGPLGLGHQNFTFAYRNPGTSMLFTNGTMPVYASSGLPHPQLGRPTEPHGWFYCLPSIRQAAFMPTTDPVLKEKLSACSFQNPKETLVSNVERPGNEQKRLLVSNPSWGQSSVVLNSGIVNPLQGYTYLDRNLHGAYFVNGNDCRTDGDFQNLSGAILSDEVKGNAESGAESEMHEDTEELNALLYSDDESDYTEEDDEVTSTGHSPSTDKQNWFHERAEEVASSCGITKKRKLSDGVYDDVPSVMDTASSMKFNRSSELEDDAESSCACHWRSVSGEMDFISSNKRIKKDKLRETVSILQNIIPGVKGKDPMVVLDEAIHFLESLKLKAKAYGLESL